MNKAIQLEVGQQGLCLVFWTAKYMKCLHNATKVRKDTAAKIYWIWGSLSAPSAQLLYWSAEQPPHLSSNIL